MQYVVLAVFVLGFAVYVVYSYRRRGAARPRLDEADGLPPSAQSLLKALEQAADSPEKNVTIERHQDGTYTVKPPDEG